MKQSCGGHVPFGLLHSHLCQMGHKTDERPQCAESAKREFMGETNLPKAA